MRNENGYFLMHRSVYKRDKQNNMFYGEPVMQSVWSVLICWANWEDRETALRGKKVLIKRGDVITSIGELVDYSGSTTQKVRRCVSLFTHMGMIKVKSNRGGLHLSICKYDQYQDFQNTNNTTTTRQQHDNNTTTTRQQQHNKT